MPPLPLLRGRDVAAAFEMLGWTVARQRGSHIIISKRDRLRNIPNPETK
jgi:predicted RNA binding protein YcfA (HicA-like mRNA interferase family)